MEMCPGLRGVYSVVVLLRWEYINGVLQCPKGPSTCIIRLHLVYMPLPNASASRPQMICADQVLGESKCAIKDESGESGRLGSRVCEPSLAELCLRSMSPMSCLYLSCRCRSQSHHRAFWSDPGQPPPDRIVLVRQRDASAVYLCRLGCYDFALLSVLVVFLGRFLFLRSVSH